MDTFTPSKDTCQHGQTIGWGKDRQGNARRRCKACGKVLSIVAPRPLGSLRISLEQATLALSCLTEGSSLRATSRVSGLDRGTVARLLKVAGVKCEALLSKLVRNVPVADVQADEIWSFVGMKEKTKKRKEITDPELGDAYTFIGMERTSKVVLAWHLGRRTAEDTNTFMAKLASVARPVEGAERFGLTTDGFQPYPSAVEKHLGGRVDYAQLIKTYSGEGVDSERRYSPPSIIASEKVVVQGTPAEERICTSHIERQNLHLRMQLRRFTRLTNAFSRKREYLRAALALHFAAYNLTWINRTIRCTPAMAAGLVRKPWTMRDLLTA